MAVLRNIFYMPWNFRGFPGSSAGKESTYNAGDPGLIHGLERSPGESIGYPLQYSWASLVAQLVTESACNAGNLGLIPGFRRSPREGNGYPLQYSGLENSMELYSSWRRKRQPTLVFMPGKSHGTRSLVGYNPWGRKELDTTEPLSFHSGSPKFLLY